MSYVARLMRNLITFILVWIGIIKLRNTGGFWYLYECPKCGCRQVHKKWVNHPDPICKEQLCMTRLIRIL